MPSMVRERGAVRCRSVGASLARGARRAAVLARRPRCAALVEPPRLPARGRLAEQVALAELDAERRQRREVRASLDALGEQPRADPAPERDERLDEGLLGVVVADAVDDVAVDLDDGRPQRGDQREARVAGAGVIDREAEAEPAQRPDLALERADIGDRLLLGALDRDLVRIEAGGADLVASSACASKAGSSRLDGVRLMA